MGVLESEHLTQYHLAHMVAWSALHAHPKADLDKGGEQINSLYKRALTMIPYFSEVAGSAEQSAKVERVEAAKRYKELEAELRAIEKKAGEQKAQKHGKR